MCVCVCVCVCVCSHAGVSGRYVPMCVYTCERVHNPMLHLCDVNVPTGRANYVMWVTELDPARLHPSCLPCDIPDFEDEYQLVFPPVNT